MTEVTLGGAPTKVARLAIDKGQDESVQVLLANLRNSSLTLADDWEKLPSEAQRELATCSDRKTVFSLLVKHNLLTEYQAARVQSGTTYGLVLGNYRVLDRLGAGGMGIVFKGEHLRMRRIVAIKVLPITPDQSPILLRRFFSEMRAVAQLQHPNIVSAIDDGETSSSLPDSPPLHYFVMEYAPGQDLHELVKTRGPLPPDQACGFIYQVASALGEAHKHNLVHRDIKPSNIRVTPDGQAKLLDFGLVRQPHNPITEPGMVLGTPDYLAPEQASDPNSVDIRTDIYGLGGTLFWCLTGEHPFPSSGNIVQDLLARMHQSPPSVRKHPSLPVQLDAVVARMMACHPQDRYQTPQAVMTVLLGFLKVESQENRSVPPQQEKRGDQNSASRLHRVLVVDDSRAVREICSLTLRKEGIPCDVVADGHRALAAIAEESYDLVLTDWNMPGMTGLELCRHLRSSPPSPNLKIILFSTKVTDDEVAQVLGAGADDYLNKQFTPVQLTARIKGALRLKESQDRADLLNQHLLACNQQLERNLNARECDWVQIRNALVLGLADLVSYRDQETVAHGLRLQGYCRCLTEEAAKSPSFAEQLDANFIQMLECCAPLHDIGKAALPDSILSKWDTLNGAECLVMQTHTTLGSETLQRAAKRLGSGVAFFQMAIDVARSHHERFDGTGYPDRLAGNHIPLAARILAIGDVYDGLRSRRTCKPALSHIAAIQVMTEISSGQFDPILMQAFQACSPAFDKVFQDITG